MAVEKKYHHGDLRAALLDAGEAELAERGADAFSLRSVARRAGVSHAAPAHHFGDVGGLLTALAARGFRRLLEMQAVRAEGCGDDPGEALMAYGLAYVDFATRHTALFRLCFASSKLDKADVAFAQASDAAFDRLAQSVAAVTGRDAYGPPEDMADTFRVWALTHGIADLIAADRALPLSGLPPDERDAMIRCLLEAAMPRV